MINLVDNHPNTQALIEDEIRRLERLLADLRRLLDDEFPTEQELHEAVILVNPIPGEFPTPALKGFAAAHPELGNRAVVTSPIVVQGQGWARTVNRLYVIARSEAFGDPE